MVPSTSPRKRCVPPAGSARHRTATNFARRCSGVVAPAVGPQVPAACYIDNGHLWWNNAPSAVAPDDGGRVWSEHADSGCTANNLAAWNDPDYQEYRCYHPSRSRYFHATGGETCDQLGCGGTIDSLEACEALGDTGSLTDHDRRLRHNFRHDCTTRPINDRTKPHQGKNMAINTLINGFYRKTIVL